MNLANRVKARRKILELTQSEVAERTGVSQQAINRIERGLISRPRYLLEIARVLECEPSWLLYGQHHQSPASTATSTTKAK